MSQRHAEMSFYDLVNNIEYLDCVFNEAQRLAPLSQISFVNRECAKSCDINGVHFPAGTEIVIKPYLLHHDSDAWPSVNEFDPERYFNIYFTLINLEGISLKILYEGKVGMVNRTPPLYF